MMWITRYGSVYASRCGCITAAYSAASQADTQTTAQNYDSVNTYGGQRRYRSLRLSAAARGVDAEMTLYDFVKQNDRYELLVEWDKAENQGVDPAKTSPNSKEKVSWVCGRGHRFSASVASRAIGGTGCPYCSGKKVLAGFNDLPTTDPALAAEWDADKNGSGPETVNRGSHKRVWWKCALGHSYEAEVFARTAGNGCPYCSGRRVLAGFNDLAATHPKVAKQWAYDLNGGVTPEMVTKGSNKKFWWRCSEGHSWQAAVFSRTRKRASDCPICAGNTAEAKRFRRAERKPAVITTPRARPTAQTSAAAPAGQIAI